MTTRPRRLATRWDRSGRNAKHLATSRALVLDMISLSRASRLQTIWKSDGLAKEYLLHSQVALWNKFSFYGYAAWFIFMITSVNAIEFKNTKYEEMFLLAACCVPLIYFGLRSVYKSNLERNRFSLIVAAYVGGILLFGIVALILYALFRTGNQGWPYAILLLYFLGALLSALIGWFLFAWRCFARNFRARGR